MFENKLEKTLKVFTKAAKDLDNLINACGLAKDRVKVRVNELLQENEDTEKVMQRAIKVRNNITEMVGA